MGPGAVAAARVSHPRGSSLRRHPGPRNARGHDEPPALGDQLNSATTVWSPVTVMLKATDRITASVAFSNFKPGQQYCVLNQTYSAPEENDSIWCP